MQTYVSLRSHQMVYLIFRCCMWILGFTDGSDCKESTCNAGDPGSIPGLGRYPGEENGYLLQYSCLEKPMNRGAWWGAVHGVTKSWTLSDWARTHTQILPLKRSLKTSKTNMCQLCLNFLKRKDYKPILNSLMIYVLKCLGVKVTDVYNSLWNASKSKMTWWLNRCSVE